MLNSVDLHPNISSHEFFENHKNSPVDNFDYPVNSTVGILNTL